MTSTHARYRTPPLPTTLNAEIALITSARIQRGRSHRAPVAMPFDAEVHARAILRHENEEVSMIGSPSEARREHVQPGVRRRCDIGPPLR